MCPKYVLVIGQTLDIFWRNLMNIDKCPKRWIYFGHDEHVWTPFGHYLDTLSSLDTFWAYYGHFCSKCVQKVSVPTSCCSTAV